jgi:two-component system NtrC family response regulator
LRVLFADDETSLQELMRIELPRMGYEATVCPDGRTAVAAIERTAFDCVIVDLDMPGLGGLDVIRHVRGVSPDTEAVIVTGKSSLETAVDAMRQGVCDYLTKPCKLAEIRAVLERVRMRRELAARLRALEGRVRRAEGSTRLVGSSAGLDRVRELIARVGRADSTVLIRGETGTGKDLVARAIHESSGRAAGPMVAVNCGALPEHLVESELFGHRRGAFTGADEHRTGLFEVADGGTLFLDEIGELPKPLQPKLLRALESGEIRRVGENGTTRVDCRVICATHRSLEEMVRAGGFREDLFFRINTFEVPVPPLRERPQDIPELLAHFVRLGRPHAQAEPLPCEPEVLDTLMAYRWPGNVRELANVIEHALVLCDDLPIRLEHLPARLDQRMSGGTPGRSAEMPQAGPTERDAARGPEPAWAGRSDPRDDRSDDGLASLSREQPARHAIPPLPLTLRELELRAIVEGLRRNGGNKPKTADELGISLKTLYNKLHQLRAESLERPA